MGEEAMTCGAKEGGAVGEEVWGRNRDCQGSKGNKGMSYEFASYPLTKLPINLISAKFFDLFAEVLNQNTFPGLSCSS